MHVFNQRSVADILRMLRTLGGMIGCESRTAQLVAQLEGVVHDDLELLRLERLGQVVTGTGLDALHRRADRPVGGHHDHRNVGSLAAALDDELVAPHPRHAQVGDHHVQVGVRQVRETFLAAGGAQYRVARVPQDHGHDRRHVLLVLDHEDGALHRCFPRAMGNRMPMHAPLPLGGSTSSRPPHASTRVLAMVRPRPVPLGLLV